MTTFQWIANEMIPALCRTLLHSLWIGLVAALLAAVIMIATKKTSAAVRYNWLVLLLGLLMISTVIVFFIEIQSPVSQAVSTNQNTTTDVNTVWVSGSESPILPEHSGFFPLALRFIDQNATVIIAVWFLLCLFRLFKISMGLLHIKKVRSKNTQAASEEWTLWIREKSRQMGIAKPIVLLQSELIKIPVAVGYLKPMVLIPVGLVTQLSPQQVETVLLHELAHIKRKDYLVNLLQTFADALFFFNPGFAWISSLIRQERENCCDDMVIAQTSNQCVYLEALMCFQSKNLKKTYAMALGSRKHSLLQRVKRMLTRENSNLTTKEISSLLSALLIACFCFMAFQPKEQLASVATFPIRSIHERIPFTHNQQTATVADVKKRLPAKPLSHFKVDTIPVKDEKEKIAKEKVKAKEASRFKRVVTNIVDDGSGSIHQVQATTHDGVDYRIRKENGSITSLSVNGKEIPREEYKEHDEILQAIDAEKNRKAYSKEKIKSLEKRHLALKSRQAQLSRNQARLHSSKKVKMDSLRRLNIMKAKENKIKQQKNNKLHHLKSDNSKINSIIRELIDSKLASDETKLSFSLNSSQLVVNGVEQPKHIHEKFKTRFLTSPEDRFKYSKNGNSTSTEIYIK